MLRIDGEFHRRTRVSCLERECRFLETCAGTDILRVSIIQY